MTRGAPPHSEPAVLLARVPAGARERLLTFLTRGAGSVRLFAPRDPGRRRPVFLEPLQGGELVYVPAAGRPFGRLVSFVPQRVWPGIRADLARTVHAMALLDLVASMAADAEPEPGTFALLVRSLDRLESDPRPGLLRASAAMRLLALAGFGPPLASCGRCAAGLAPGTAAAFEESSGTLLCASCARAPGKDRAARTIPVRADVHGFLARSVLLPEAQVRRLRAPGAAEDGIVRLAEMLCEAATGRRVRTGPPASPGGIGSRHGP